MTHATFPSLSLAEWQDTRDTLHRYARVLGKIRRAALPPQKHWWHSSLHVSAVGLTTSPLWTNGQMWGIVMNLADHQTHIVTSRGQRQVIAMKGQSAAEYCTQIKAACQQLELAVAFDTSACDETAGVYDATAVTHFWQALSQITAVFTTFKHSFRHESSPIQLWPHHFDLALLWLSGRLVPDQDPDDPEYADEQMNFGFVTGDAGIPEPYFYATAYPTPDGLTAQPLPAAAYWHTAGWTGAILPYAALTKAEDPPAMLLDFLQIAHHAGASLLDANSP